MEHQSITHIHTLILVIDLPTHERNLENPKEAHTDIRRIGDDTNLSFGSNLRLVKLQKLVYSLHNNIHNIVLSYSNEKKYDFIFRNHISKYLYNAVP